jgi:acetolactate synthase I/II/III large subunit
VIATTESLGISLARSLQAAGVGHVFGVPGGQTMPLYGGILETDGIEHILMRDERSAVCAADAYSRITRRIGVCDATVGPGATNLVSGVAEAYGSSVALLAIIADIPRNWEHRRARGNASQAIDQTSIFAGISKWVARVMSAEALDDCLRVGVHVATSGRPGPVVLCIADDVFCGPSAGDAGSQISQVHTPAERFAPDPHRVSAASRLLAAARRPVIVAGGGAVASGAHAGLHRLAGLLECPVVTTMSGKSLFEEHHRLALGVCGSMGNPVANRAISEADLVCYVGCKAGQAATLSYATPAPGTSVIQVDIDPEEIGRNFPDTLALVGDAQCAVDVLLQHLEDDTRRTSGWDVAALRSDLADWIAAESTSPANAPDAGLRPQWITATVGGWASADDALVADASLVAGWTANFYPVRRAGQHALSPRGLAGIGWGPPAAVGAAVARRELELGGRTVLFSGDGAFAYSLGELEVMRRLSLPVTSVILNNSTLGWIKHIQEFTLSDYLSVDFCDVDFSRVAEGFGVPAWRVTEPDQLHEALRSSESVDGPCLIEVVSDETETAVLSIAEQRARPGGGFQGEL